jgi:hypothetical protein
MAVMEKSRKLGFIQGEIAQTESNLMRNTFEVRSGARWLKLML